VGSNPTLSAKVISNQMVADFSATIFFFCFRQNFLVEMLRFSANVAVA